MSNRDIAGLLTGIPSGGMDPMATLTPRQMRAQTVMGGIEQRGRGLRGLMGGDRRTPEEQRKAGLAALLRNFDTMQPAQQKQIIAQLQASGQTGLAKQLAAQAQAKAVEQKQKTDEQKRLTQLENFSSKPIEEQKNIINVLRASGETALAGQLAGEMSREITQAQAQERLDIQRLTAEQQEKQLGAADKKYIRRISDEADEAGSRVSTLLGLANDYSRTRPMGGVGGKAMDKWKSTFGTQDEVSRIKTHFQSVVNTNIINSLPPGVASDKDIEMAKSGYMNNSWSAEQIEEFLRGQAKLSAFVAEKKNAKAQWVSDRGGDSSGFNEHWRKIISQEGYKEMVAQKYGLSAYRIPAPDVEFNPDLVPTGNTSGQSNPLGRVR